jgi:hypothetical protein
MTVTDVTVGSDVEFFLRNRQSKSFVSAEPYVPGTKYEPVRFDPAEPFFATQLDNILAEGNIPPARSAVEFSRHLRRLREHLQTLIPADLELAAVAGGLVPLDQLQSEVSKTFGCDPSYNAWSLQVEPTPTLTADNEAFRCAGFHVHIGYTRPSVETNIALARAMDLYLGVPSVLRSEKVEKDRRSFGYGRSGNFRHQQHGVEYRSLSSAMVDHAEWAYRAALQAVSAVNKGMSASIMANASHIQAAVNDIDKHTALWLVEMFGLEVPA